MEADSEMQEIDHMEDVIAPITPEVAQIRELISSLELCHHKAERWVNNIIEAIGVGNTTKGLGTRRVGKLNQVEQVWEYAYLSLKAWLGGVPDEQNNLPLGNIPANQFIGCLAERTPLKAWQVERVMEKIRSVLDWAKDPGDPDSTYRWILLSGAAYETTYRNECPDYFKEQEQFWLTTVHTMIRDTENGDKATLSLGLAIDMLWPCHWRFMENLRIVLSAIGGKLQSNTPFAACGRNIQLVPNRNRLEIICNSLMQFCGIQDSGQEVDEDMLVQLGEPIGTKKWLAASLEKTVRLQLDPPLLLREMSALSGPKWIKE